ncbi:PREDICTED: inositol hexakisphosphate and diphosphoinositol-pentakisphosphate kinase 2 isoform X2 [Wasmannia auropunctata]|uniref:inositol hexakisphosphate and diphosphoinositol-pentakisphosphate kinase 2 isoform X2 n=1 Tax=Wasmannia auropunctata TaxID=64793 RepID=UPI0005F0459B|nr:PREDICTED: inositol hexakisphosphate and diphosphoinositol-pentakisphosphate kinase 2 isoform X2 [Wasmannia auropunctata]
MSYTELEHGYQGLRNASRPMFYIGDINTVQPSVIPSLYRSSKRPELSDGTQDDAYMGGSDVEGEGKQVLVGICAMAKKSQSKPMKEILTRLEEFEYIKIVVFPEEVILKEPVEDWPIVDCLISFHSKGFPLDKAISYANLRKPFIINHLPMQYDIQDRRRVYAILESEGIEIPRYAVLDRDSPDPKQHELVESEDHVEVNGVTFNKPFVEKPVSAEDHNIYIYYPTSAGGGSQRLFRKIGSRSSVYSPESRVRKSGSYIYEDFMPTDGTDVKVYTVGPDYAHAEARKSPALDGKVERDSEGKEIRYPVILNNAEKLISRKVCLAFKQTVCGFDLLRANGQSFVCDVNGFSFVKNSNKYYDDCAKILGNMILRELAPTLHIPWSVPFQLDDPPIVPTTFGKMMELRCVVAVIRHGDRTPKQKMKVEVRHPKFFEIFAKYDGYKHGHVKLKRPKQLQEILDTARSLLAEIQHRAAGPELEEKQGKLEQLKSVLEMYGHFSGINRKVQLKYQPRGRPRGSSSDDGSDLNRLGEPSLVLILKWGGELTPAGRIQAEELGRIFRCMYPGGQEEESEMLPNHGEYAGAQGLGLLRLHSTFRHDLKIYASDEGRVQMTAAAFAKGLLALEGELTPILVQMVKSANTNGLLDNDCDSSKYQNMVKTRLHELLQQDREFTREDREQINPGNALSINAALDCVKNPVRCCQHVHTLIQKLLDIVRIKKEDPKTKDTILYHGETWELMGRRWGKIEKDFCTKNKRFDISKIPDIYDCIKYDLQHNNHTLQFEHAEELYTYAKSLADIVIPQEYGLTVQEKLTIGQGICTPLLKKIRADLQRNIEESEETVNRLNPRYSHGVSSPGRHVRTRLYFTSESHVHSLLTVLRYGGLLDMVKDEQWRRAMEYVSMVSELNYMSQIVVMLYEDPTKDPCSEERFHVELHFSPGVNCCVQKNLPPGPGFRPHSRNESSHNVGESGGSGQDTSSQCSTRIEEEDAELGIIEDDLNTTAQAVSTSLLIDRIVKDTPPPLTETDTVDSMLDSPTTSRGIDMMDLDPNMMDEPYDSGFLQSSAPIPISARTVAGHEAARLSSQLAASQRQRRSREVGSIVEPRARSYDHQRQEKPEKAADKLQYQSLDAVNKEDTRSRIIQPDPTCTARRHRHSISGQMSYFKLLGYSVSKKLTGSANSLFSTAVISGSSSAPNLKDMVPPHASAVAAIEGFGGVPPIRPLETLHNALSLRQLDSFLEMMTTAPLYRTPASSPPKSSPAGSTHESLNPPLVHAGISREYHSSDAEAVRYIMPTPIQYKPLGEAETCHTGNLPSPTSPNSTGWSSEPQSFLSSEPSSPAPTSTGECSMSISLISNESAQLFIAPKFSPTSCLDVDFNEFCIRLDQENRESRGSVSYTDYYSNEDGQIRKITQIPQVIQSGAGGAQTKLVCGDDVPCDNLDEDEDHTLTLKQSEEQKKQDLKSIFEQRDDVNPAKLSGSYKKIGRFVVESTDISHGDVRIRDIKDTDKDAGTSDKAKLSTSQKSDTSSTGKSSVAERTKRDSKKSGGGSHVSSPKRKNFSRSQSVTTPKQVAPNPEATYSYTRQSSFSTMSDADLESWKLSAESSRTSQQEEEPILTVASSLTDSSNVTVGFDVKEEEKN